MKECGEQALPSPYSRHKVQINNLTLSDEEPCLESRRLKVSRELALNTEQQGEGRGGKYAQQEKHDSEIFIIYMIVKWLLFEEHSQVD